MFFLTFQDLGGVQPSLEELAKKERDFVEKEYRDWLIASSTIEKTKRKYRFSSTTSTSSYNDELLEFD